MKIGLLDVDGHNFPNLALMKISRYFKSSGHSCEWYNPFVVYDRVYMSKVFTYTPDYTQIIGNAKSIFRGGGIRHKDNTPRRDRQDSARLLYLSIYRQVSRLWFSLTRMYKEMSVVCRTSQGRIHKTIHGHRRVGDRRTD